MICVTEREFDFLHAVFWMRLGFGVGLEPIVRRLLRPVIAHETQSHAVTQNHSSNDFSPLRLELCVCVWSGPKASLLTQGVADQGVAEASTDR